MPDMPGRYVPSLLLAYIIRC